MKQIAFKLPYSLIMFVYRNVSICVWAFWKVEMNTSVMHSYMHEDKSDKREEQ